MKFIHCISSHIHKETLRYSYSEETDIIVLISGILFDEIAICSLLTAPR